MTKMLFPLNLWRLTSWFFSTLFFEWMHPQVSISNSSGNKKTTPNIDPIQHLHKHQFHDLVTTNLWTNVRISLSPASNSPRATSQGASARWHADKAALNVAVRKTRSMWDLLPSQFEVLGSNFGSCSSIKGSKFTPQELQILKVYNSVGRSTSNRWPVTYKGICRSTPSPLSVSFNQPQILQRAVKPKSQACFIPRKNP